MASTTQIQTPYASFSTMSRDISVNGGAWYTSSNPTGTLAGQQSVGDLTGFIKLRGWMYSAVVIPEDIAKAGDTITTTLRYNACGIRGDTDSRTTTTLKGSTVSFCPTMTAITDPNVAFALSNPVLITMWGDAAGLDYFYLGNFQLSASLISRSVQVNTGSNSGTNGSSTTTAAGSNPNVNLTPTGSPALISAAATSADSSSLLNGTQSVVSSTSVTAVNGSSTTLSSSITTTNVTVTVPASANSANASPALTSSKEGSGSRIAGIVGGVVGGLILLGILAFAIFRMLKARRKRGDWFDRNQKNEGEVEELGSSDGLNTLHRPF